MTRREESSNRSGRPLVRRIAQAVACLQCRFRSFACLALIFGGVFGLTAQVKAAEAVLLENGTRIEGEILDWDERGVSIRLQSGRQVRYGTNEIKKVEAAQTSAYEQAQAALARWELDEAIIGFRQAIAEEKRTWARHQCEVGLLKALCRKGELDQAANLFISIFDQRPDADVMSLAPLVWSDNQPISDSSVAVARQWLLDSRPIARLLAASWLLNSPSRGDAHQVLDELQTIDQRIGWMARGQLWRENQTGIPDELLTRMQTVIDKMPASIRGGPQFVYAVALDQADKPKEAAIAYLWVAYVYDIGSDLAAESLVRGALASRKAGFPSEADKILKEVVQAYPGSKWATRAQNELTGISDKGTPNG